jgi:serine protease Do
LKRAAWILAVLGLGALGCATTGTDNDRTVIGATEKVAPALVHIRPVKEVFARGRREEILVVGSGFIVSPDGYVVTNEHVAGDSSIVRCVLFNREEVEAEVVGTDPYTDVAVLKLETDTKNLPTVQMGDSASLRNGQTVLALGSPLGLARSVSKGIVSVTDRHLGGNDLMQSPYNTWIQTDAAINPGNSGGPLVNLQGEVVGVNTRKLSGADNVGFAIPVDTVKDVMRQIIEHGRVRRSWAGILLQEMISRTDDPEERGVVIADINALSPAAEAGILPGDILLAVQGSPTHARFAEDLPAVEKLIADLPVGEEATFTVSRGGQTVDVAVRTEELSDVKGAEVAFPEWGFTVAALTPAIVRRAGLDSNKGVLVSGIEVGGLAGIAGLAQADVIQRIDGEEVTDLTTFRRLYLSAVESGKRLVLLDVRRGALTLYILVRQEIREIPNEE